MNHSKNKIKVLVIIPTLCVGSGVASHVMNYYKKIHNKIDIDFATYDKIKNENTKEILENGGKIFYFKKSFLKSYKSIKWFFKEHANEYDIVHCHTFNYGLLYLYFAKKYNIKNRILHIHSVRYSDSMIKYVINVLMIKICQKLANDYVACSSMAGKKAFKNKTFYVLNNAIVLPDFSYDLGFKKKKELGISEDEYLFGNVGRFVKTKNQIFALKVFSELKKNDKFKNSKFLLIGDGPCYSKLLNYIKKNNLEKDVVIVSDVFEIGDYYAAMDCFIFPSLSEGLGIAPIEAQSFGASSFCSDTLPNEIFISEIAHALSLKKGAKFWADIILSTDLSKVDVSISLKKAGFDIDSEANKLIEYYTNIDSEVLCK